MKYKNVIFDCDSTLVKIEGLDEIARRKGKLSRVQEITAAGMNGNLLFSQSLRRRLNIIRPTSEDLVWLGQKYLQELVPDAPVVIGELRGSGLNIFILTGGLLPAVKILGGFLGVDVKKVFAVDFTGFIPLRGINPVSLDTFKDEMVKKIRSTGPTVLIGDGMTDYEAGRFADLFIGFGGVIPRPKLKRLCRFYVEEPRLQSVLSIVL